jgi:hypothetical protein
VAYGLPGRTFDVRRTPTPGFSPSPSYAPVAADFNGDGYVDLAVQVTNDSSRNEGILVAQADNAYGSWRNQTFENLGFTTFPGRPVVGDWNRDQKPDIVTVESFSQPATGPAQIVEFLNTSSGAYFANCTYPATASGISVCNPTNGSRQNPSIHFSASVNSLYPVRKVEVWVDGAKIKEAFKTWTSFITSLQPGAHRAVFYSAGYDNSLQKKTVNFTVAAGCPPPGSPGVNVCSPVDTARLGSPVSVLARGAVTGTILRMEVWVDGTKKFSTFGSNTLQTSLPLNSGPHSFAFFVVNTAGAKWQKVVSATVK